MGRGSKRTHLFSQMNGGSSLCHGQAQCGSPGVSYCCLVERGNKHKDLPNVAKILCGKMSSSQLVAAFWLKDTTQHWQGPVGSAFPVRDILKPQSSQIILFRELIDF